MGTEQFCLRWNDFHSNITAAFSDIRDEDDFLDVTLVCDAERVRAHKLILCACSPLFRAMLKGSTHPHPIIFLRGIRNSDMVSILNFMYNGEVNVNQEDLQSFLAAAEELRIKGLSQTSSESVPKKGSGVHGLPQSTSATSHTTTNGPSSVGGASAASVATVDGRGSADGAVGAPPPAKRSRAAADTPSPASTPHSAKSPPLLEVNEDDDQHDPPQLSVKPEFSLGKVKPGGGGPFGGPPSTPGPRERVGSTVESEDEGEGSTSNLLDCLVQAQNFALQQGFEQNMSHLASQQQLLSNNSQAASEGKNLLQFLGQNNVGNAAANALMMQRLLGTGYELHPLGSRKDEDPFSHIKVARSSKGWHCPQCIHISSTKGNLKSHILSGRHKTYTEKPFGCQYCDRSYGTKQSLQVHISTNHRAERDAEYQALSKSLGMKSFPEAQFYMKQDNFESVMSPAALQQLQHQLQQAQVSQGHLEGASQVAATLASLSSQPNLTIQPTRGLPGSILDRHMSRDREEVDMVDREDEGKENMPSCRLEARNNSLDAGHANKRMEIDYATVDDGDDEEENSLPMQPNTNNMEGINSITTP